MNNKRAQPRRDTVYYLPVYQEPDDVEIGRLADISESGLLILATKPLPLGVQFAVGIGLPEGFFGDTERLRGTLDPKWQRRDTNPNLVLCGCYFDVDAESQPIIQRLMQRYSFSSGQDDLRALFEAMKEQTRKEH